MKTMQELKTGNCKVVAEAYGKQKEFNGFYDSSLKIVFFVIPSYYEIVGYIQ